MAAPRTLCCPYREALTETTREALRHHVKASEGCGTRDLSTFLTPLART
jgi:hypothetical protein